MTRFLCIHGHFYQPPRENPWLEEIELQDSAYPYHDWNERITDECYRPNSRSRILDNENWITSIVNNYSRISFNFGPTVLSWMQLHANDVHEAIVEADRLAAERFSGHGSAIAQVYNHMIMPLANQRDKQTQVIWGIRDFEHRFGRKPEGMWLAETAADVATLEVLAEQGIAFTILAPRQAARHRPNGGKKWIETSDGGIDPTMVYRCALPSGRSIALFFYDGPVSQAVAFERLLNSGETFAHRLTTIFDDKREHPQLANIATDGESYGHHHRHGDMALAYALDYIESKGLATLTNYAEFLEKFPPQHEAEVHEASSWSCIHGVERWRADCGCHSGGNPGWNQKWRAPLRNSLDNLRDKLTARYEQEATALLKDPWAARNDYINIVLDRSPDALGGFAARHATAELDQAAITRLIKLLEIQRQAMLMYTSCGWFFDELTGIETVQVIQYAGRAIQLAEELAGEDLESGFLNDLAEARSNITAYGDGRQVYQRFARPAFVDLPKVGAHYAVSTLFEDVEEQARLYCFDAERDDLRTFTAAGVKMRIGRATLRSRVTLESQQISFMVLHLADHIINGGARAFTDQERYEKLAAQASDAFERGDFGELLRMMEAEFGGSNYSLGSLFKDEQRKVADSLLAGTVQGVEAVYRQVYENQAALVHFLSTLNIPAPRALRLPAELVINADLRRTIEEESTDPEHIERLVDSARKANVKLEEEALSFAAEAALDRSARRLQRRPSKIERLEHLTSLVEALRRLPFEIDLSEAQNIFYRLMTADDGSARADGNSEDVKNPQWREAFNALGQALHVRVG